MSQDFFTSVSAIGSQSAVQSQTTASLSTNRPGADAFAQLFAQNQIDADRRRDERSEKPTPAIAARVLAAPYDLAAIDQAPRGEDLPPIDDAHTEPLPARDDRRPADDARSESGRLHSEKGQARADAVHARNAERTHSRQADQASRKEKSKVGAAGDDAAGENAAAATEEKTASDGTTAEGKTEAGKTGADKTDASKTGADKTDADKFAKGDAAKDKADNLLAADAAALVEAAPAATAQPIAVDITTAIALKATIATEQGAVGTPGAASASAIGTGLPTFALAAKTAEAGAAKDETADETTETPGVKSTPTANADAAPKGLEQALKLIGQSPAASNGAAAETAIQKAIASFETRPAPSESGLKPVAGDLKPASAAFPSAILLNAALPDAPDFSLKTGAPIAAAQHPATLATLPVAIGSRALNGGREFTIHLYPAELGKVEVKLEISEKGDVKAKLTIDRVETLQLLQRDARSLHQALEQAGFKPSDDGVQFSLRQDHGEQASQRQSAFDEQGRRQAYAGLDATDASEPSRDVTAAVLAAYARRGNSALDIHV